MIWQKAMMVVVAEVIEKSIGQNSITEIAYKTYVHKKGNSGKNTLSIAASFLLC